MINYDIIAGGERTKLRPPKINGFSFSQGIYRMSITKDDPDTLTENAKRSGISFPENSINPDQSFDISFDISFDKFIISKDIYTIFQLYSAPTRDPWSPPLAIKIDNGVFTISTRRGNTHEEGWRFISTIYSDPYFSYEQWNTIRICGQVGKSLSIWINGAVVFSSELNPWGYKHKLSPVFGLYQWKSDENWDNAVYRKTLLMRNISLAVR